MESTATLSSAASVPPEVQFARILENFQLKPENLTPFDITQNFISISAARALEAGRKLSELGSNVSFEDEQEFASWDMETKLWHLVTNLYSFRLTEETDLVQTHEYSSFSTRQRAFLQSQPKLRELIIIIHWLQHNSQEVFVSPDAVGASKWINTRLALQNKDLNALASSKEDIEIVDSLDVDAPLRTNKNIMPADRKVDSANFEIIYQLVLSGDYQRAVDHASQTGNFTLALILVGAQQDYVDPILDGEEDITGGASGEDFLDKSPAKPSGLRHKYLWLQTVYNLSCEERLPVEERLIYSYLSGGDQTENIKYAGDNWDDCLLLYINQLLTHHVRQFMKSTLPKNDDSESLASISFPSPEQTSVESILNTMSKSSHLAEESKNPFRVIMGAILINQLNFFLDNTFKSTQLDIVEDQHILRVLAHLAVFSTLCGLHEGSKTPTKIITRYISRLSEYGYEDLVPVYLAFIPDERDVRECYSIFLTTITDSDKRAKQIEIFKKLGHTDPLDASLQSETTGGHDNNQYEYKIHNVLKRTVERVMAETEGHYIPQSEIQIEDTVIDSVDSKLCRSVEWFFENHMYEDAINATRTLFHRFLSTGRLKAIREFGNGKNLKSLLKDHDFDMHTKSLGSTENSSMVTDCDKDELVQYEKLLECLLLLKEWRTFIDNQSDVHWTSKDVENSIEKITKKIQKFIYCWFREMIESSQGNCDLYKEYRSIYVPYFIIELLQIYYEARLQDRNYIRQAFRLVSEVANDKENDLLACFLSCGRISEFIVLAADVAAVAAENDNKLVFA